MDSSWQFSVHYDRTKRAAVVRSTNEHYVDVMIHDDDPVAALDAAFAYVAAPVTRADFDKPIDDYLARE